MNRATRTFLWGLFLLLIGAAILTIAWGKLKDSDFHGFINYVNWAMGVICLSMGIKKINKTTD